MIITMTAIPHTAPTTALPSPLSRASLLAHGSKYVRYIIESRLLIIFLRNDPQRPKTYLLTCAPNDNANQLAHPNSLIRVFIVRMKQLCILGYRNAPNEDSDQTARMRRPICIFAVPTP